MSHVLMRVGLCSLLLVVGARAQNMGMPPVNPTRQELQTWLPPSAIGDLRSQGKPGTRDTRTGPSERTSATVAPIDPNRPPTVPVRLLLAHAVHKPTPTFPKVAATARTDGAVVVALEVGKDGKVTQTVPLTGRPELLSAAELALKEWTFEPFMVKGVPQVVRSAVSFQFRWRGDGTRVVPE